MAGLSDPAPSRWAGQRTFVRTCLESGSTGGLPRRVVYAIEIVAVDDGYAWVVRSHGKTLRRSDRRHESVAKALRAAVAETGCVNGAAR